MSLAAVPSDMQSVRVYLIRYATRGRNGEQAVRPVFEPTDGGPPLPIFTPA